MKSLLLALLLTSIVGFSQEYDIGKYIETYYGEMPDSVLLANGIDSLSNAVPPELYLNESWDTWRIVSSPDSTFKIFQFMGEGCGAYCNPWIVNYVVVEADGRIAVTEYDNYSLVINEILILTPDKDYLLLGEFSVRARGVESVYGNEAVHIRVSADSLVSIWGVSAPISNLTSDEINDKETHLIYYPEEKSIEVEFNWYNDDNEFRVYHTSARYSYDGESFNKDYIDVTWLDEESQEKGEEAENE